MGDEAEQEILATIRTFLALERNFLAEERTELAQFRTGLAIILIVPTASTIVAFLSSFVETAFAFVYIVLSFTLFTVLIVWGLRTIFRSRSKLRTIRENKMRLKARECKYMSKSKTVNGLIGECIFLETEKYPKKN